MKSEKKGLTQGPKRKEERDAGKYQAVSLKNGDLQEDMKTLGGPNRKYRTHKSEILDKKGIKGWGHSRDSYFGCSSGRAKGFHHILSECLRGVSETRVLR